LQKKNSIPFVLITGFLGSGKTTLLANILKEFSQERRIVVIQNEFAPSGTDGKDLKLTGYRFHLEEINNGSVFCICLLNNFIQTLQKVLKHHDPDMIILESSGLSDPFNILEILQDEKLHNRLYPVSIFSVTDALNFEKGMKNFPGFRHQIMVADTIIINKTDIATSISVIKEEVRQINPFATIIESTYCLFNVRSVMSENSIQHRPASQPASQQSGNTRPAIKVCVMRTHEKISIQSLQLFLKTISHITCRTKGHVNLVDNTIMSVQSVFDHWEIKQITEYSGPTEIIAFSENLTPSELKKLFLNYTTS